MSNSHRTSCEFLKDIFGRNSGADGRRHAHRRPTHPRNTHERAATSDATNTTTTISNITVLIKVKIKKKKTTQLSTLNSQLNQNSTTLTQS